jgi:hypothetical protein
MSPMQRFKELSKAYRLASTLPASHARNHEILLASSLQQVLENGDHRARHRPAA